MVKGGSREVNANMRLVAVAGSRFVHAMLLVDEDTHRTACWKPAGDVLVGEPSGAQRCPDCWADWRVRGERVR